MRILTILVGLFLAAASFGCGGGSASNGPGPQSPSTPISLLVSNVSAGDVNGSSAVVTWMTNLPSTSQVEYGTSASYGSMTPLDSTSVTSHSVFVSGLKPGIVYHYRVHSS